MKRQSPAHLAKKKRIHLVPANYKTRYSRGWCSNPGLGTWPSSKDETTCSESIDEVENLAAPMQSLFSVQKIKQQRNHFFFSVCVWCTCVFMAKYMMVHGSGHKARIPPGSATDDGSWMDEVVAVTWCSSPTSHQITGLLRAFPSSLTRTAKPRVTNHQWWHVWELQTLNSKTL